MESHRRASATRLLPLHLDSVREINVMKWERGRDGGSSKAVSCVEGVVRTARVIDGTGALSLFPNSAPFYFVNSSL